MRALPANLQRDPISVRERLGVSSTGPEFAAAVSLYGRVEFGRRLVRNADGDEVVSEVTLYVHPDDADPFTPLSEVTLSGYVTHVISAHPQGRPGETVLVKVTCE